MKFKNLTEDEFRLLYRSYPIEVLRFRLGKVDKKTKRLMPLSFKWIAIRVKKYGLAVKPKGRPEKEIFFKGEVNNSEPLSEKLIARMLKEEYGLKMAKAVFDMNDAVFPKSEDVRK